MSYTLLRQSMHKARTGYSCMGADIIIDDFYSKEYNGQKGYTPGCFGHIRKGQEYICRIEVRDGDIDTFRTCKTCMEIISKYNLYSAD